MALTTRATRFDLYSHDPYTAFLAITLGLPVLGGMVIPSSLRSPSKPVGSLLPGAGGFVPFIPHPPTEGHRKECRTPAGGEWEGWCTEDGWKPLSEDAGSAQSPHSAHRCLPFPTAFSPRTFSPRPRGALAEINPRIEGALEIQPLLTLLKKETEAQRQGRTT